MKTLTLAPICSNEEMKKRSGENVDDNDYDYLINDDCDAYTTDGEPLFFFRKNKIGADLCFSAYKVLRNAASPSRNRGTAGGEIVKRDERHVKTAKGWKRIKFDGTVANTNERNTVNSGIVGYFDRGPRFPFCRQTAWFSENFNKFSKAYPFIKTINELFREACQEKYEAQKKHTDKTLSDWILGDTVFSTITVNKNFRTSLHKDAGDCIDGLGNLAVLSAGNYEGAYTVIPRYRVAFDVRSGDVCFFNVHEYHGNTAIKANLAYERISIVCYFREKMVHCLSAEEELSRVVNREKGESLS